MLFGIYSHAPQFGKTTLARIIQREYGGIIVPFAKPIKEMVSALLQYMSYHTGTFLEDKNKMIPGLDVTARELLQTLGTEWARDCLSYDFWLDIAKIKIGQIPGNVIIDDVRFRNEWDYINSVEPSCLIKVERPGIIIDKYVINHGSEGNLSHLDFDIVIDNKGTIDNMKEQFIEKYSCFLNEEDE